MAAMITPAAAPPMAPEEREAVLVAKLSVSTTTSQWSGASSHRKSLLKGMQPTTSPLSLVELHHPHGLNPEAPYPWLHALQLVLAAQVISSWQELPSPPHTPQISYSKFEFVWLSQPRQVELSPPHSPQASMTFPEPGIPSHPLQVSPVPKQTPQIS